MPYRLTTFLNQNFYHIFNRGVEKRKIFSSSRDFERFIETAYYYQFSGPKPKFSTYARFRKKDFSNNPKIVEIICYCLMPNHFHLLLRQLQEDGIKEFISKVSNSYTKYFNTKHNRVGHLLQGEFKAVAVDTPDQLLHLTRYIHLNPYVSNLTNDLGSYIYSSYSEYIEVRSKTLSSPDLILCQFKDKQSYEDFVKDHQSYALEIERIKHLVIDE